MLILGSAILWLTAQYTWERSLNQLEKNSALQLAGFVSGLEDELAQFSFLPELLAKNRLLSDLLRGAENSALIDLGNRHLEEVNAITGAAQTYLMDVNGVTVAASNWNQANTFVGQNFVFRPYFQEAMRGKNSRYFALGTTSKKRGYYFAHPIIHAANIIGVIVLKMDIAEAEQRWSGQSAQFLVTDQDGIVFISTRPDWLYRSTRLLTEQDRASIIASRRYPGSTLELLSLSENAALSGLSTSVLVEGPTPEDNVQYVAQAVDMPEAGWRVRLLAPIQVIQRDVTIAMLVVGLSYLLLIAILMLLWQRHRRHKEHELYEIEAKRRLEQMVRDRTIDLTHEIEVRRLAEQDLIRTRGELVQAGKLAVLGELSASISHELNNPLAAIKSYADNGRKYLIQNNIGQVDDNLDRIMDLTDRMAEISAQLKVFSRKSSGNLEVVLLTEAVRPALDLVGHRCKEVGVELHVSIPEPGIFVKANVIQLEQVVVNLLSNAIQAIESRENKAISLSVEADSDSVLIHVDDSGAGVEAGHLDKIFEPFFTTKKSGLGLGLSISYRIIESMGGRLMVKNLDSGGARFSVHLPRASANK